MTPTLDNLNQVYDICVRLAGAQEHARVAFCQLHMDKDHPCREWRILGNLGYGGKYRIRSNSVDIYREDETPEMNEQVKTINANLEMIELFG